MDGELDLPPWNLKDVALLVVCHADELAFLQANPAAVHPSLTPHYTWDSGINQENEILAQSDHSQAETDVPGSHPAALLLRGLPKNGGAYMFGRDSRQKPDVALSNPRVSRRHFCVYPDLRHRTWVVQALSDKGVIVDDCEIGVNRGDHVLSQRALQYDCFNRVVFAQTPHLPGLVLYIKPVWPDMSSYLRWDWQDPNLPELAAMNLSWTLTSPLPSLQSQSLRRQEPANHVTYCLLNRRLCDEVDIFYGQDLETGAMIALEKLPSESEAKEQFSWRTSLKDEHLLMPSDLFLRDHPYILAPCPFDVLSLADVIEQEPLNDRTAFALLQGMLSALSDLLGRGVAGISLTLSNILVADLSPGDPRFWLAGVSSARPIPENQIKAKHSNDVEAATQILTTSRDGPKYFTDPVANAIFTGSLEAKHSQHLSAKDLLESFAALTNGEADYPFKSTYLVAEIAVKQFQFNNQVYYQKTDLARIASALFSQTAEESQKAYTRVLYTKSGYTVPGYEGQPFLRQSEMQKLFERLGKTPGSDFWLPKKKRKRELEKHDKNMQEFCINIQITYHAPSQMWNMSQLINAIRPVASLDIGDLSVRVEVGGDTDSEGLYFDYSAFESVCRVLHVSSPERPPDGIDDGRAEDFRSASDHEGDLVLADRNLLGTAIFKRSSRTMLYGGTEYTEDKVLQLFPQSTFVGLHRAISQSRHPPPCPQTLCQGQPAEEFPESQCGSMTESQSEGPVPFKKFRKSRRQTERRQPETLIEEWTNDQLQRRRRSRADILPHAIVDGYLQQVDTGVRTSTSDSSSCSTITTVQTTRCASSHEEVSH